MRANRAQGMIQADMVRPRMIRVEAILLGLLALIPIGMTRRFDL